LIEVLGRIPNEDESPVVEVDDVVYKIEKIKDKRIITVKVSISDNKNDEEM